MTALEDKHSEERARLTFTAEELRAKIAELRADHALIIKAWKAEEDEWHEREAVLTAARNELQSSFEDEVTKREKLEAEMDGLRGDAERYRWMRERHENTIMDIYNSISPAMIKPELLDAAIDAERKGK